MEDGRIRTQFDDLISSLQDSAGEPQSIRKLAKLLNAPDKNILSWARILEHEGKAELINRFDGVYVSWVAKPESSERADTVYEPVRVRPSESFSNELQIAKEREQQAHEEISAKAVPSEENMQRAAVESAIAEIEKSAENAQAEAAPEPPAAQPQPSEAAPKEPAKGEKPAMTIEKIRSAQKDLSSLEHDLTSMESAIEKLEKLHGLETEIAMLNAEAGSPKPLPKIPEEPVPPGQIEAGSEADRPGENAAPVQTQLHESGELIVPMPVSSGKARPRMAKRQKYPPRMQKIERGAPIELTEVSLLFSDRMHRQLAKIEKASREVEALRAEKESLLNGHYLPMERKLESELETIGDRITTVEDRVFSLQKRAADLPSKVWALEKLQASTIGAHDQMRRAYDEAAAVIEESGIELAEELGKMEELAEQARAEIASHGSKTNELQSSLERINQFEGDLNYKISIARDSLTEQAQRLASAENYSQELAQFREEIRGNVAGMRREMGATKAMLTELERQMESVRHVHEWTNSIKGDYDAKMQEIDDYVKNGDREFETLREAVEARYVRKYLRELRALSESYTYELGEAKAAELTIDQKVEAARARLSRLIEEGQKMAYKYESSAKAPEDSQEFSRRAESFEGWSALGEKRTAIEQMVADVVGRRTEYVPSGQKGASNPAKPPKKKARKSRAGRKGRVRGKR